MIRIEKVRCNVEKYIFFSNTSGDNDVIEGRFYQCDVLEGLPGLMDEYKGKIKLVYIDPPFFTGKMFNIIQKIGHKGWSGSKDYSITHFAYNDKWKKDDYLYLMKRTIGYIYDLLSSDGCIYVHIDYRTSAYIKVILDEVFGEDNFINEIIWSYKTGGRARKHFSRKHDTILFYGKSKNYYFNIDAVGKKRGKIKRNNMKKSIDENGNVYWSIKSGGKEYRYDEESLIYPSDVWDDISHLQQKDPERTGYDTQKPELLLERIIQVSSKPGDLVADFFSGSATTLFVAQKLGRNWIGMDKGLFSLHTARRRLVALDFRGLMSFFIQSGNNRVNPILNVSSKRQKSGLINIYLEEYKLPNEYLDEKCIAHVNGLDLVDYWSVGIMIENTYFMLKYEMRSERKPELKFKFTDLEGNADYVIQIVDIMGNNFYYKILEIYDGDI